MAVSLLPTPLPTDWFRRPPFFVLASGLKHLDPGPDAHPPSLRPEELSVTSKSIVTKTFIHTGTPTIKTSKP